MSTANMTHHDIIEQVPDSAKVVVAGVAPMASLMGLTVEEWSFVLSGVVALLFIIEKLYRFAKWLLRDKHEHCKPE